MNAPKWEWLQSFETVKYQMKSLVNDCLKTNEVHVILLDQSFVFVGMYYPFSLFPFPFSLFPFPFSLFPFLFSLFSFPFSLFPFPFSLFPFPFSLFPFFFSLFPIPYSLFPLPFPLSLPYSCPSFLSFSDYSLTHTGVTTRKRHRDMHIPTESEKNTQAPISSVSQLGKSSEFVSTDDGWTVQDVVDDMKVCYKCQMKFLPEFFGCCCELGESARAGMDKFSGMGSLPEIAEITKFAAGIAEGLKAESEAPGCSHVHVPPVVPAESKLEDSRVPPEVRSSFEAIVPPPEVPSATTDVRPEGQGEGAREEEWGKDKESFSSSSSESMELPELKL
jgi:hypothetical protein